MVNTDDIRNLQTKIFSFRGERALKSFVINLNPMKISEEFHSFLHTATTTIKAQ
jgi:hypothetical protein